ncbi:hypothetical protein D3C87_2101350 [compost metagenome]
MNLRYQVETKVCMDTSLIVQDVFLDDGMRDSKLETLYTNVLRLQDEGIRDALIKLGWTPPPEKKD